MQKIFFASRYYAKCTIDVGIESRLLASGINPLCQLDIGTMRPSGLDLYVRMWVSVTRASAMRPEWIIRYGMMDIRAA